jgi:bisphosphoglycerate-independent phosphoglycerate mutase (AlkP superfamily)
MQRAEGAEAQLASAQAEQKQLAQRVDELSAALAESQQKELDLSDSLILLNERADRATSMSPTVDPAQESRAAALSERMQSMVRSQMTPSHSQHSMQVL